MCIIHVRRGLNTGIYRFKYHIREKNNIIFPFVKDKKKAALNTKITNVQ
jgi:hypothetical protein